MRAKCAVFIDWFEQRPVERATGNTRGGGNGPLTGNDFLVLVLWSVLRFRSVAGRVSLHFARRLPTTTTTIMKIKPQCPNWISLRPLQRWVGEGVASAP